VLWVLEVRPVQEVRARTGLHQVLDGQGAADILDVRPRQRFLTTCGSGGTADAL